MSATLTSWLALVQDFIPAVSFAAGLGGSLHCVGMCGGLVTATCERSREVVRYQFGRLVGYLALGAFGYALGSTLDFRSSHPLVSLVPAVLIGALFVFWGVQSFRGKRAEVPLPRALGDLYGKLWKILVRGNRSFSRAFFTGLISIFLPCGLLYGIVLSAAAFGELASVFLSITFFWLGTLPSMVAAPAVVQKVIRPLKLRLPKTFAVVLVSAGLLTIAARVESTYRGSVTRAGSEVGKHRCH